MKKKNVAYLILLVGAISMNAQVVKGTQGSNGPVGGGTLGLYVGAGGGAAVNANATTTNLNVGIGTNNPSESLDVNGNIRGNIFKANSITTVGAITSGGSITSNSMIQGNTITSMGKLGIGTTTPLGLLDIKGGPADGQSFTSVLDSYLKSIMLNVGSIRDAQNGTRLLTFFDIPSSNINSKSQVMLRIDDRVNMNRLKISAMVDGYSDLELNNASQQVFFRASNNGTDFSYLEMPKADSHFVIGGEQAWPIAHKLWVKAGTSKFEGDVFADSNIGIGTSVFTDGADTYKLSVKGKIRAEEVRVYTTWADYVFMKDYKLPSLSEVEKYIKENGHLQNVPSAKEVTEKGLQLGDMVKIQQEKIEELTLYLIQQNKEMEALKAEVKALAVQKR
ncbi:hypothetical protein [Flavobacterium sp. T12S277]|uniref:hypothetical protein n=1 Tax=Flavobacterium sp. T12S277 TaxID=3402752 RepID=UPI003AE9C388